MAYKSQGSETNHSKPIFRKRRKTINQNMEATVHLGRSCVASFCQLVQKAPFISLRHTLGGTDSLRGALAPYYLDRADLQLGSAPPLNLWKIAACPDPNNIGQPRKTINQNREATVLRLGISCVGSFCQVRKAPFISLRGTIRGTDSLGGAARRFYVGRAPQFNLRQFGERESQDSGSKGGPGSNNANAANNHDGDKCVRIRKPKLSCHSCDIYFWEEKEKNILLRTRCNCVGYYLVHEKCLTERALHEKRTHECNACNEAIEYIPVILPNPAEKK